MNFKETTWILIKYFRFFNCSLLANKKLYKIFLHPHTISITEKKMPIFLKTRSKLVFLNVLLFLFHLNLVIFCFCFCICTLLYTHTQTHWIDIYFFLLLLIIDFVLLFLFSLPTNIYIDFNIHTYCVRNQNLCIFFNIVYVYNPDSVMFCSTSTRVKKEWKNKTKILNRWTKSNYEGVTISPDTLKTTGRTYKIFINKWVRNVEK